MPDAPEEETVEGGVDRLDQPDRLFQPLRERLFHRLQHLVEFEIGELFAGGRHYQQRKAEETRHFFKDFAAEVERFRSLTVWSGLSFGDYAFLARGLKQDDCFSDAFKLVPHLKTAMPQADMVRLGGDAR